MVGGWVAGWSVHRKCHMHLVFLVERWTPCSSPCPLLQPSPHLPPPDRQGIGTSFPWSMKTGGLQVTLSQSLPFLMPLFPHLFGVNMPLTHEALISLQSLRCEKVLSKTEF